MPFVRPAAAPVRRLVDPTDARNIKVLINECDLRSTTAERIRVMRHKCPEAHHRPVTRSTRPPAGHSAPPVKLGYCHQMPGQVLRQPYPFQLPFPILGGDVRVSISRFSASEYSRATPCMSCDRGPVSSYIRPRCGPGSARTHATTRAASAAPTGLVLSRPNGSSMRPWSRSLGPVSRSKKPSRKTVGRIVTTDRPGHASACPLSHSARVGPTHRRGLGRSPAR